MCLDARTSPALGAVRLSQRGAKAGEKDVVAFERERHLFAVDARQQKSGPTVRTDG